MRVHWSETAQFWRHTGRRSPYAPMADANLSSGGRLEYLDQFSLPAVSAPDRLPPMLFLAALIHGILIIGITFNAVIGDYFSEAVSLEVTIVADPDKSFDRLDDAMYLAQASQEGSGNTEELVRPGAPLESSMPIDNIGVEDGDAFNDKAAAERSSDDVLATRRQFHRQYGAACGHLVADCYLHIDDRPCMRRRHVHRCFRSHGARACARRG